MSNKVIYEPNQYAKIGFFKTMLAVIKNTAASKELILQLYKRDFLMQYKKSFLGSRMDDFWANNGYSFLGTDGFGRCSVTW